MEKKFRYDAFISYRHTETDKFVAANLHKQLENFRLPRNVAKKMEGRKTKIERVFRDKEELPLTNNLEEPILEALQDSEWLIVVCSPRLRESLWCRKEIETFISLRGRAHVLAVLIEGEPEDSFPEELLYEIKEVKQPDGTVLRQKVMYEPLAADFRGKNKREMKKAMDTEIIRVLAAMFELSYDDLKQRHRERKLRRLVATSLGVGAACLAVGTFSTVTAIRINEQKERIEVQSEQIMEQSEEIFRQSEELERKNEEITAQNEEVQRQNTEITKKNEELALHQANALSELAELYWSKGNKAEAEKLALQVLTEQNGMRLPHTAKAQQVLTDCLAVYDIGGVFRAEYQVKASGRIDYIKEKNGRNVIAIYDDSEFLRLYDMEQRKELLLLNPESHGASLEKRCAFLGEDRFAYFGSGKTVCIYNYRENRVEGELTRGILAKGVWADSEGTYLVVEDSSSCFTVYSGETLEKVGEITKSEDGTCEEVLLLPDGKMVYTEVVRNTDDWMYIDTTVHVWDLNAMEHLSSSRLGNLTVNGIRVLNDVIYVISGEYSNAYLACDTHVTAISSVSGEKVWDTVFSGQFPEKNGLYGKEESEQLLCMTKDCLYLVSMTDGTSTLVSGKGAKVANVLFVGKDGYYLFIEDGELVYLSAASMVLVDKCEEFLCVTSDNAEISFSTDAIWVLANNDDKLTFYLTDRGPDVTEYEKEIVRPDSNKLYSDKAKACAKQLGSERPEYVQYALYNEDERYCAVVYWDDTIEIFDAESKQCLSTLENLKSVDRFVGPDENGWMYLWGITEGYILNEKQEPVARIKNVYHFDAENRKVYVRSGSTDYEIPVYDLEELLALARVQ